MFDRLTKTTVSALSHDSMLVVMALTAVSWLTLPLTACKKTSPTSGSPAGSASGAAGTEASAKEKPQKGTVLENQHMIEQLRVLDGTVFFSDGKGIKSVDIASGKVETLTDSGFSFVIVKPYLFYEADSKLMRADLHGIGKTVIAEKVNFRLAANGNHLFFELENRGVFRVAAAGNEPEKFWANKAKNGESDRVQAMTANQRVLLVNPLQSKGAVFRVTQGEGVRITPEPFGDGLRVIRGMVADETHVYHSLQEDTGAALRRVAIDGGGKPEDLALTDKYKYPEDLALDAQRVYWTQCDDDNGTVQAVAKSGGKVETIVNDSQCITEIAIAGDTLYWGTKGTKASAYNDATIKRKELK